MARLFGALANAGAQYNKGRFAREQYDAEQQKIARDEARRVFEFAATQDRLKEQARQARQDREQELLFRAQEAGYVQMGNGVGAVAQEEKPYETMVEGRPIRAQQKPSQYLTIGGKTLRRNQQSDANAAARAEEAKALWDLKMRRDVAQANEDNKSANRRELQAIINAGRQPPQRRTQIVKDETSGELVIVDMDQVGPTGLRYPKRRTQIVKDETSGELVIVDMDQVGPTGLRYPKTGAGGAKSSPVTSNERNKLADIQEIRRLALDAREKMQNIDGFAGPFDKPFQRVKTMIGSPDMAKMEAMRAYQRLASPAARQTIGTAMTPQEIKRLDVWLPMLENTDENVIRAGVEGFFREADAIYRERMALMKASGINTDALEKLPAQFDAGRQSSTGTSARTGTKPSPREALGIPRGQ